MNFPFFIARRYLFSKKSTNAINIISGISMVGVAVATMALGIVLGVFVLRIIFVALSMLGMDPSMQYIIKGGIILAACSLDMRKYLAKK